MGSRANIARLIGAVLCSYLVVLQVVLGGLAMAGQHRGPDGDVFAICTNSIDGTAEDAGEQPHAPLGCCALGCVSLSFAPAAEPTVSLFVYDQAPSPLRATHQHDAGPPEEPALALKRPRGPPAIG